MTSATDTQPTAALALDDEERAILAAEVPPFAATLQDPALRARYEALTPAIAAGEVPAGAVGLLEALLELLLQTQRLRRQHGPAAERAMTALYYRTPRGARQRQSAAEVTTALGALHGQALEALTFAPVPGGQRLTLATDQCHLEIIVDRTGVRLERVELGRAG